MRSTFYRIAMIAGQGGLVFLAGKLGEHSGDVAMAWSIIFFILGGMFAALFAYHRLALPIPAGDHALLRDNRVATSDIIDGFVSTFTAFFKRRDIGIILAFLLLFRFGEAQALKLAAPFLLDATSKGGLGLSTAQVGLVYGTIGVIALTLGGLLGGYAISRQGLKRWIWPMLLSVHLPNLAFVFLAFALPSNIFVIAAAIAVEQFGYGFGFAAYLLFMIMVADGAHKTAHYAICTGFMALGMMLPGMASGWIQEQLGYPNFFIWVCVATVPSLLVTAFIKIDPAFGRKAD